MRFLLIGVWLGMFLATSGTVQAAEAISSSATNPQYLKPTIENPLQIPPIGPRLKIEERLQAFGNDDPVGQKHICMRGISLQRLPGNSSKDDPDSFFPEISNEQLKKLFLQHIINPSKDSSEEEITYCDIPSASSVECADLPAASDIDLPVDKLSSECVSASSVEKDRLLLSVGEKAIRVPMKRVLAFVNKLNETVRKQKKRVFGEWWESYAKENAPQNKSGNEAVADNAPKQQSQEAQGYEDGFLDQLDPNPEFGWMLSRAIFPAQNLCASYDIVRLDLIRGHLSAIDITIKDHRIISGDYTGSINTPDFGEYRMGCVAGEKDKYYYTLNQNSKYNEDETHVDKKGGSSSLVDESHVKRMMTVIANTVCPVLWNSPQKPVLERLASSMRDMQLDEKAIKSGDLVKKLENPPLPKEPTPLNKRDLERMLLLLNEIPGVRAEAFLKPTDHLDDVGGSTLAITANYHPLDASVSFNNYGSRFAGAATSMVQIDLNNPTGYGEKFTLVAAVTSPTDELHFSSSRLSVPIGYDGLVLTGALAQAASNPGLSLKELDVNTHTNDKELSLRYPITLSYPASLYVASGYEYHKTDTTLLGRPYTDDVTRKAFGEIELSGRHERGVYEHLRQDKKENSEVLLPVEGVWNMKLRATQGLSIGGQSHKGDLLSSRQEAEPNFSKWNGEINYNLEFKRPLECSTTKRENGSCKAGNPMSPASRALDFLYDNLFPFWGDRLTTVVVDMRLAGQYSDEPLFATDEFSYGGRRFGRGYEPGEYLGDRAWAGSIEVGLKRHAFDGVKVTPYAVYDTGFLWNDDTLNRDRNDDYAHFQSFGYGVKGQMCGVGELTMEIDRPIGRRPARYSFEDNLYVGLTINLVRFGQEGGDMWSNFAQFWSPSGPMPFSICDKR